MNRHLLASALASGLLVFALSCNDEGGKFTTGADDPALDVTPQELEEVRQGIARATGQTIASPHRESSPPPASSPSTAPPSTPPATAAAPAPSSGNQVLELGQFTTTVPEGWVVVQATPVSIMGIPRLAQIKFPAVEGDAEDGDLKVNESGGGVDANIARWYGQLSQPDGTPTAAVGVRELLSAGNINIHFIDALGTFAPPPMMAGSAGAGPRPNWRLFGAIIETPRGLLTFKATGPDKTMSANREKMRTFLTSLRTQ